MSIWSVKEIQDIVLEQEEWEKKNLYATDSEKCPRGLYYSLIGEKASRPIDPEGLRRMEVGQMIERNQVEKLKSLGLLIEAQRRIYDEEGNVSGRHDGIIISPLHCSEEAKGMIERKKEIYKELKSKEKIFWNLIEQYNNEEIPRHEFIDKMLLLTQIKTDLYDEDKVLNKALLIPNPENELIVIEIKSIVEAGFKWRMKDGRPMDSHIKQLTFYLWKLREIYPNMKGRVIYVDTSYQRLLEFDVELDLNLLEDMKKFWKSINEFVENKELPPESPDIVQNPKTGRYQVNYQAEWCRYHDKCTGKPNWLDLAIEKVKQLNSK
jgi:CRISPR/Cas system-associated exonuclease Cas4 (RecB family)